jgi:catechol 2,3-dioxygenase-like lactoylglutathione lyase family enzyme
MIKAIDHINIVVSNLKRSVDFYTNLLGFQIIRKAHLEGEWIEKIVGLKDVSADVVYIVAPAGEPRIELLCYKTPRGVALPLNSLPNTVGLRHIALRVENINLLFKSLKDADVRLFGEPVIVPTSVIQHDAGYKTLLYFTDPDGVILELAEYT